jgi:hypothetical protein
MAIVKADLPTFTGFTTLELVVYQDGVLINSDGNDALQEAVGSFGRFTADVSQALSGTYEAVIVNASGSPVAFGYFDSTSLLVGRTSADSVDLTGVATESKQDQIISDIADIEGGGGGGQIVVYPYNSSTLDRVSLTRLKAYVDEEVEYTIIPKDSNGSVIDTTGLTMEIVIEDYSKNDILIIPDVDITKTSGYYSFVVDNVVTGTKGKYYWSARNTADSNVISQGTLEVFYAAVKD